MKTRRSRICLPLLLLSALSGSMLGCGDEGGDPSTGEGALSIRISGEDAAKTGYPLIKEGREITFADGWNVQFSKFLVSFGDLRLRGADDAVAFDESTRYIADLHAGDPAIAVFEGLEARRWERFSFKILPPEAGAVRLNDVPAEDIEKMTNGGYNYWIEGTATKGGATYPFAWGLANPTRNSNCTNGTDGTDGFVVKSNATTEAEITIHVDHMFWDTLGSEVANLRFDAIAAAAGDDAHVDFDELEKQRLADLKGIGGGPLVDAKGEPIVYNPGSIPLEDHHLKAFILAAAASQAHVNGLGLCTVSAL